MQENLMPKIKIDKDLYERINTYIKSAGYSSIEEFIQHCIEKELNEKTQTDDEQTIKNRLKGLGYF
jgi:metal-responsive CopG/Arc/MetJ family transcriptional regulator